MTQYLNVKIQIDVGHSLHHDVEYIFSISTFITRDDIALYSLLSETPACPLLRVVVQRMQLLRVGRATYKALGHF